jgi:hypothetical protein
MGWHAVRERLEAWPAKALARFAFEDSLGRCCALTVTGYDAWPAIRALVDIDDKIRALAATSGLEFWQATNLVSVNDSFAGTPKARYAHVLAWVRQRAEEEEPDG